MNVIVIGATGTIGRLVVQDLLAEGHSVTAFARHPEKLSLTHPALSLKAGDAQNEADVTAAVAGHEAVFVTLGAGMSRKSRIRSQGTLAVIRAMQATGVRRLVVQSTLGTHETWSNLDFFWKRIMFGALLRPVHRDHELQESLVRASGLDWTIVRPAAFSDGPATGRYQEDFPPHERKLTLRISRADIAAFLARQLSESRYLGSAVSISN